MKFKAILAIFCAKAKRKKAAHFVVSSTTRFAIVARLPIVSPTVYLDRVYLYFCTIWLLWAPQFGIQAPSSANIEK
jgi:hypothetical protein